MIRVRAGEDSIVAVKFSVTTRSTRGLAAWAHDYNGKTLWCEFSIDAHPGQTTIEQSTLPMSGSSLTPSSPENSSADLANSPTSGSEPAPVSRTAAPSGDERDRCPFPQCVEDADHAGDHQDAFGNSLAAGSIQ
jgi:hypothetical protein